MSQSQAKRARLAEKALLELAKAVVDHFDNGDSQDLAGTEFLRKMAKNILDGSPPSGLTPAQIADPMRFFCPYCEAFRPGYGINYQRHPLPGIGIVGYLVLFCAECRHILTNAVIEFSPDHGAAERALEGDKKVHLA